MATPMDPTDQATVDWAYRLKVACEPDEPEEGVGRFGGLLRRDLAPRMTVALDGAGRMAGFTELRVGPEAGALASTEDTAVLPSHRGRGLASWVKSKSLRLLRQDRTDVTTVVTHDAETNAAMLAVNAKLGFGSPARWQQAVVHIAR